MARSRWWRVGASLSLALLALLALVGFRGWQAGTALREVRARVPLLQQAVADGDRERVGAELAALEPDTTAAVRATNGPLWRAISFVPYAGRTPRALAGVAVAVDTLVRDVLPSLAPTAAALSPDRLRPAGDRLDLAAIAGTAPLLAADETRVREVQRRLGMTPTAGVAGPVAAARGELDGRLQQLADTLGTAATATAVLPAALGRDGPRHWFVALQTDAESRGTGGLVGAYLVLTADRGRLSVTRLGSNLELRDLPGTAVDFGPDYQGLYGADPTLWSGTNLSPHFPYAAQLWLRKWQAQTGERLDGALAIDPVALARVLQVTGPVRLADGETVSGDDAVALTERDAYVRFAGDDDARKTYLVGLVRTVVARVLAPQPGDGRALAGAVAGLASEGRLQAWSAHAEEQAVLARLPVAGITPAGPGAYLGAVVTNAGGNKLDYYLRRSVDYDLAACRDGRRATRVAVRLDNDLPAEPLPVYVTGASRGPAVRGSNRLVLALHATRGARLTGATLDGRPVGVFTGREQGRPVFVLRVDLAPGQARDVVLSLDEPAGPGAPVVRVQPLVLDQTTVVRAASC